MKSGDYLTDVPWETKNLGLESREINDLFWDNPIIEELAGEINEVIRELGRVFIQAKVPKNILKLLPELGQIGFYGIETRLETYVRLKDNNLINKFRMAPNAYLPKHYADCDIKVTLADKYPDPHLSENLYRIAENSFRNDRFHLDPKCSPVVADRRYRSWLSDLWHDAESKIFVLSYGSEIAGFMAVKGNQLPLAALDPSHFSKGLGDFLWLSVLTALADRGHKLALSALSANNTSVLNICARTSFKFRNPRMVIHYWSGSASE